MAVTAPHFLFPSDPLNPKEADEIFSEQVQALRELGHGVSLFALEELQLGRPRLRGPIPPGATVVYRGWMLSAADYGKLVQLIESCGGNLLSSLTTYLACHHLPNWYPLVPEFTAETKIVPAGADLGAALADLGWGRFFLKDFVKSLKTSVGSVVSTPEEAKAAVAEMEKFRGTIEGGICARRFEAFRPGSERRCFVLRGRAHAAAGEPPALARECARRIPSPFFAVDTAIREDGAERLVELGDGQVSDLVGWTAKAFASLWLDEEPKG